jgi:hypothetical protein
LLALLGAHHILHVSRIRVKINKLRNVASCWLHFGNILKMHGIMNIKSLFKIVGFYEPARSFILIYFILWWQKFWRKLLEEMIVTICKTEWPLQSMLSCLQLQAISVLLFLCVAVRKDLKILSWKTTALVSLALPVCLFVGQNSRATEKIFITFLHIYIIFIEACKFVLKSDKVVGIVTEKYRKTWMPGCAYFEHNLQSMCDYVEKRKRM